MNASAIPFDSGEYEGPAESSAALQGVENFAQDRSVESASNGNSRSPDLDHDAASGLTTASDRVRSNDACHSHE
jgi:hypothetical protein